MTNLSKYACLVLTMLLFFGLSGCFHESAKDKEVQGTHEFTGVEKCRELAQKARQLVTDGKYDEAVEVLYRLIDEAAEAEDYWSLADAKVTLGRVTFLTQQFETARKTLEEAIVLADYVGDKRQMAESRRWMAEVVKVYDDVSTAITYIDEAIEVYEGGTETEVWAFLRAARASFLADRKQYNNALNEYFELVNIYEELEHDQNLAIAYNQIGLLYLEINKYEDALEYFFKAYDLNIKTGSRRNLVTNLVNMGLVYDQLGEHQTAIDTLKSSLAINEELGLPLNIIRSHYNIALSYREMDYFDKALEHMRTALESSVEQNLPPGIMYSNYGMANLYMKMDNPDLAYEHALQSKDYSRQLEVKTVEADSYEILRDIYRKRGELEKALDFSEKYYALADEINKAIRDTELDEIKTRFEVEQREAENKLLRRNLDVQEALTRNQTIALIGLGIGILVCAVLLVFFLLSQFKLKRAIRQLEQQKEKVSQKNSELERLNDDRNALLGVIVHDMKNPLSAITGFVELLQDKTFPNEDEKLINMIGESANRMQSLVTSLLNIKAIEKENIHDGLLRFPIRDVVEPLMVDYRMRAAKKLILIQEEVQHFEVQSHIEFVRRIIDNLVSNAIKFSPAGTVVQLSVKRNGSDFWKIIIADQGPGFTIEDRKKMFRMFTKLSANPTGGETSNGVGLYTIKLLVEKLGGTIEVLDANPGAKFIIRLPGFIISSGEIPGRDNGEDQDTAFGLKQNGQIEHSAEYDRTTV